jgi:hypothetical protein
MGCNTLIEPACRVVGHLVHSGASGVTGGVLDGLAQAMSDGVRWVVVNTATWWLQIPSPDLAGESAVARIQQWLLPITAAVAVGGVIAAGARMALTRRANPLIDVTGGLLTLAAATTLGVTITTVLLKAGDAWSAWILQESTGGQFTQRLELVLGLGGSAASAVMLIFGIIAIVLSLVQAVLMLFRQAALVILAGALPLAAAGAVTPMTRAWVRKVTAWMLALICYKPAAAAVYAAAFTMIGSGSSPRTTLMGFVMLLLSVLTLPALMKFFTWTTGAIGAPGGGGGQLLNAATIGAIAVGAMRSGAGGSAQDQASYLDSALGPPPGGGAADSPGGQPPDGSGPGGPPPSGPGPSGPGGTGPGTGGGGPSGASPGPGSSSSRKPPPWPGPPPPGAGAANTTGAGTTAAGTTAEGGAGTALADTATGASGGGPGGAGGTAPAGAASTQGTGAATGAASGAGAAVTGAAEAARAAAQSARYASGAMDEGDQQ